MQRRLVRFLGSHGIGDCEVFALRAVESFPRGPRAVYDGGAHAAVEGFRGRWLPFVNVQGAKQLTSGISLVLGLGAWALRRRRRPRAILMYNVASPPGIFAVLAARLTGSRAFAVVADLQVPGSGLTPDRALRRADYRLQRWSLQWFDGLVVLTRRIGSDCAPRVPSILMEGAVPPELEAEAPKALPRDDDDFVVMYGGDLSRMKGLPLLLDAFRRLDGPRFRLWIAGKGELEAQVRQAAEMDPRITYLGFPEYAVLLRRYRTADVLVNPHSISLASSRYVFPSKLIEYLATGTPVITTVSTPEVREYEHCAVLLEDEAPEALAEAIREVACGPAHERQQLGTAGREYVLRHKTWGVQAGRIVAHIQELCR